MLRNSKTIIRIAYHRSEICVINDKALIENGNCFEKLFNYRGMNCKTSSH